MDINYIKSLECVYKLDLDKFIEFIISDYKNNHDSEFDNFVDNYLCDNIDWYLEKFGCEDVKYFEEDILNLIYDEVIDRMDELNILKTQTINLYKL